MSEQQREQRIRERAYQIWEGEGRPAGRHEHHWLDAANEIDGLSSSDQSPPPPAAKRARKPVDAQRSADPAPAKRPRAVRSKAKRAD